MSHAAPPRSAKKHHEEEHENHERWAVSYADMMTVLLALFIVLYAISQVDQVKFEELRESLAIGFGQQASTVISGSTGALEGADSISIVPDLKAEVAENSETQMTPEVILSQDAQDFLAAAKEYQQLDDIEQQINDALAQQGLDSLVEYKIDERGLIIGMVGSEVFFTPDEATMTNAALTVIDTMAGPLRSQSRDISIEGHANVLPSTHYATNWELSSARATAVLRRLVEAGHVSASQIAAVGYGDARPQAEGMSDAALAANRRVDIVILSSASDDVRALLPQIVSAIEAGELTGEEIRAEVAAAEADDASAAG